MQPDFQNEFFFQNYKLVCFVRKKSFKILWMQDQIILMLNKHFCFGTLIERMLDIRYKNNLFCLLIAAVWRSRNFSIKCGYFRGALNSTARHNMTILLTSLTNWVFLNFKICIIAAIAFFNIIRLSDILEVFV